MFDSGVKKDLNFLKSSGFTKKQRMKASAGFLMILVILVVIGGLGGYTLSLWMQSSKLEGQIKSLESALNDPQRELDLNEYLTKKEVLTALQEDNKQNDNIKQALEKKYRVPYEVMDIIYGELIDGGLNTQMSIRSFDITGTSLRITGEFKFDATEYPKPIDLEDARIAAMQSYLSRLNRRAGEGAFLEVIRNSEKIQQGTFAFDCKVDGTLGAQI